MDVHYTLIIIIVIMLEDMIMQAGIFQR